MFKKKIKVSNGLLVALLLYAVFVAVLYFRMTSAEKTLADYNNRLCPSPYDCRNVVDANILDYGSSKVSFTNYGSKGMPLESGTFEEYIFTLSIENLETIAVNVLPNTRTNLDDFDMANVYIPTKSDSHIIHGGLFNEKTINVEIWRGKVTLILVAPNVDNAVQSNQNQTDGTVSISSLRSIVYEAVLPTENHPAVLAGFAKNDLYGWTVGLVFMLSASVFGMAVLAVINGVIWLVNRLRKNDTTN